jgi:tryptophan 2,3-dioxygenase
MPVMTEEQIGAALSSFDVAGYVEHARAAGRARLPHDLRARACELYLEARGFRAEHSVISRRLDDALELAESVLFAEWFLSRDQVPRYRAYTNVGVLDWYLQTFRRAPYQDIWRRCAAAIKLLLQDLIAYEANSLAGLELHGTESFDAAAVRTRVERLRCLLPSLAAIDPAGAALSSDRPPAAWEDYLSEHGAALALIHLTAFTQTNEHDEYLFLRAIHISECCFRGILTSSLAAIESLKRDDVRTATSCLEAALPFAELLTPLFQAVRTMGPERFRRFRDATGSASAVQSRTYQLMQITLTGVHPDTIKVLVDIDELCDLQHYDQRDLTSLAQLAAAFLDTGGASALSQRIESLSRALLRWRKLHRGIARNYLADVPEGTGGTSGPSYLKHTVEETIVRRRARARPTPAAGN